MSGEKHPSSSILEKFSSTIHSAEEGVVHTFQGVAEGIKHSTSQILHGTSEEAGSFAKGIREANESIPRSHQEGIPGALSGESRLRVNETAFQTGEKIGEVREIAGSALEDVKEKGRAAQSMVQEQVSPISEAVQEKGTFQGIGDTVSEKAHSIADRAKELLGEVSKEAGHVSGAIKSNDPKQKLQGRSGVGVAGRSFEESIQREYEAGQQEQFDPQRRTLADDASEKLGSAKEEAVDVAKGAAHQYGEVAEDIRSKIQEGREYRRRSSQN
jgi:phage-related protein